MFAEEDEKFRETLWEKGKLAFLCFNVSLIILFLEIKLLFVYEITEEKPFLSCIVLFTQNMLRQVQLYCKVF